MPKVTRITFDLDYGIVTREHRIFELFTLEEHTHETACILVSDQVGVVPVIEHAVWLQEIELDKLSLNGDD